MKTVDELMALMPGIELVEMLTFPFLDNGEPVPVFTSRPPDDGSPSINTLEGWIAAANRINRQSFLFTFGREPENDAELDAWVKEMCT